MTVRLQGGVRGRAEAFAHLARHGRPSRLLLFGPVSFGDDLLCSAVLREARRRGTPMAIMTARPELFAQNIDPERVIPFHAYYVQLLRRLGTKVIQPYYAHPAPCEPLKDILPKHHIIVEMCRLAGLSGAVSLRPYLFLQPEELDRGRKFRRQISVHSTCLSAKIPYPTKDWGATRFAEVTRLLRPDFSLVQVGDRSDPQLPVDLDLRGQTSLRETAAVIGASVAFLGLEGFLAHLARAVDCPAVVIHGGRAPSGIFSYTANRNFFTTPGCSPCGLRSGCPHDLVCLSSISPTEVAFAVRQMIQVSPPRPLAAQSFTIT